MTVTATPIELGETVGDQTPVFVDYLDLIGDKTRGKTRMERMVELTEAENRRETVGKAAKTTIISYVRAMGRQASSVSLVADMIGDEYSVKITRSTRKGTATVPVPQELLDAIFAHRSAFTDGEKPWFRLRCGGYGLANQPSLITDFKHEPDFEYTDEALMMDLAEFPRDAVTTPEWFQARLAV